jgi:uncharacterized protein (DUF433 family)
MENITVFWELLIQFKLQIKSMSLTTALNQEVRIIRTERGLVISGTRLTIYEIIDLLKANYPPKLIRDKFNLTEQQINAALSYIKENQIAVEREYQQVLETRVEIRSYWEEYNRERFAIIANIPHKKEQEKLWAKLEAQKEKRIQEKP